MALLNAQLPGRRCLVASDAAIQPYVAQSLAVSRVLCTGRPNRVRVPCGLGSNSSSCCSSGSSGRDESIPDKARLQGLRPLGNARCQQVPAAAAAHGPLDLWQRFLRTALSLARLAAAVLAVAVASLLMPRSAHASGQELSAAAAPAAAAMATPHDHPHHPHRPSCSPHTPPQSTSHSCFASTSLAASLRHTPHPSTHGAGGSSSSSSRPHAASVTPLAELAAAPDPQYAASPATAPPSTAPTSTTQPYNNPHSNSHASAAASASSATDPLAAAVTGDDPSAAAAVAQLAASLGVTPAEAAVVRLYDQTRGSVVCVSAMRAMASLSSLDLGRLPAGQGSGVLWGDKGHVVTAHHLVKGAGEVKVGGWVREGGRLGRVTARRRSDRYENSRPVCVGGGGGLGGGVKAPAAAGGGGWGGAETEGRDGPRGRGDGTPRVQGCGGGHGTGCGTEVGREAKGRVLVGGGRVAGSCGAGPGAWPVVGCTLYGSCNPAPHRSQPSLSHAAVLPRPQLLGTAPVACCPRLHTRVSMQ